jgi:hypothetical protein
MIDVLQKFLSDRGRLTGKLPSVMTAGQRSHTIQEGIDVEVNADDCVRYLIALTYALRWSLYASIATLLLRRQRSSKERSIQSIRSDVRECSGRFGETDFESCRALLGPPWSHSLPC